MSENEKISIEIKKLINKFFERAAESLIRNVADKLSESDKDKELKNILLEIILIENYFAIDVQNEYLELLDDIDKLVYGKKDENNSYVSYYKDNELFETDVNISDIIEKVKQSSNSGDIAEILKEEVKKRLLKKNGYMRIAQLYYYKKNHKWYAEELEKAYREVIVEIIDGDEENCFIVTVCRKVESRTQEIVGCAANTAYFSIYDDNVPDKYKPNIEDYIADINSNTPLCVMAVNDSTNSKPQYKYYKEIIKAVNDTQYISIEKSHDDFSKISSEFVENVNILQPIRGSSESATSSAYAIFFKESFSKIAGFDYYKINNICENKLTGKFILKRMSNDLNYILLVLMTMVRNLKRPCKKMAMSRFVLINDIIDYGIIREAIILYRNLIKAVIKNENLKKITIESCQSEEVEMILNSNVKIEFPELIDRCFERWKRS